MNGHLFYFVALAFLLTIAYNYRQTKAKTNMDMNKHIVKIDDNKPFHSNGYAQAANGDQLGATANISFEQRQLIDRNRVLIDNYNRSTIGGTYSVMRAKPVTASATNRTSVRPRASLQQHNSINAGPRRFTEPQSRTFNPYA